LQKYVPHNSILKCIVPLNNIPPKPRDQIVKHILNRYYNHLNFKLIIQSIFLVAAIVILTDFIIPGEIQTGKIITLKKERQQYYNAARNHHYSYKVITKKDDILVDESFAKQELKDKMIEFSVSRIFSEVNWYRIEAAPNKNFYSLRIASGVILPILMLLGLWLSTKYKIEISTLLFIVQILMLIDLFYLLM